MIEINAWLERVIKGIVFAIYNVFYSLAVIWSSPGRGTLMLWRRWRRGEIQQFGPHSLLLVSSCLFAIILLNDPDVHRAAVREAAGGFKKAGDITIWHLALDASMVFVTLDIGVRLMDALDRKPRSRRHKDRRLALELYVFAGLVAFFFTLKYIDGYLTRYIYSAWPIYDALTLGTSTWIAWLFILSALILAAVFFRYGKVNLVFPRTIPSLIVGGILILMLASIALYAPGWRYFRAFSEWAGGYLRESLANNELTTNLACTFDSVGGLIVEISFSNESSVPLAVDTSSFQVKFWKTEEGDSRSWVTLRSSAPPILTSSTEMAVTRYIVIPKGNTEQIALAYSKSNLERKVRDLATKFANDNAAITACQVDYQQLPPYYCDYAREECKMPLVKQIAVGIAGMK
ncbi:hypothetical protein GGE16_001503 [Rhizobium leguminosarum]|uniref:Uncharacterized protein n=1 Tax=Rhizobium leguminosarum TaxID=384 RepID=A0AAE2MHS5_RHILE|nr:MULTISPECIES: hypothetical protein [Rhizobium]MBB4289487.1 hypothetical protein [Rhizobium leguminosarum]MBB4294417.1 hypothetical protein [Rhizobium leguminosarum]MBB4305813.1 hypothetical protein [Rhizobium leguminosarum]MBB4418610.1 hypothetical protein [Rhizobium leguminosarum]MBB4433454.1 hypothetical protein [Rhizobium esperanzae]